MTTSLNASNSTLVARAPKQHLSEHIYQAMLILNKSTQGLPLQKSIHELNQRHKKTSDYAKALSYLAIRQHHTLSCLIDCFAPKKLSMQARNLLLISFVLLIHKKNIHQAFTVVNQSTQAAKIHPKTSHAAGLINALLRSYLRCLQQVEAGAEAIFIEDIGNTYQTAAQAATKKQEDDALMAIDANAFQKFKNFWLTHQNIFKGQGLSIEQILNQLPLSWQFELKRAPQRIQQLYHTQNHPPMMLRVNATQTTRENYLAKLKEAGFIAKPYDFIYEFVQTSLTPSLTPYAVELIYKNNDINIHSKENMQDMQLFDLKYQKDQRMPDIKTLPGFETGAFAVQDAVAQIAPQLLELRDGLKILDACSAPGGKILSCLEQYKLHADCVEIDAGRAEKILENFQRLNLNAQALSFNIHQKSMAEYAASLDLNLDLAPEIFDRIILDVPCSTSGVLRKHPEMVFAREALAPAELAKLQREMLNAAWRLLKADGILLYITCSILPIEGIELIEKFKKETQNCTQLSSPLHIDIDEKHDGFFYVRLQKIK